MKVTSIDVIKTLRTAGFEAYWAGGCVRDMVRGVHPQDIDIATSARPDDLKKLFPKLVPIGEEFGVMLALHDGHNFEIATFRSDVGYSDGRRPDSVEFTTPQQDALRRDFTINGLFYDPIKDEILDFVGGQEDLQNKLIRFIGDPHRRIVEDHLRILRAIRFKNTLGFQYHPETFAALKKDATLVGDVAGERVRDELSKMLAHESFPEALEDMEDTGVLAVILPEIQAMKGLAQPSNYHKEGDVFTHTLNSLRAMKPGASEMLRWAVFLHDSGKVETFKVGDRIRFDHHAEHSAKIAGRILQRLHVRGQDVKNIQWLVEHHMMVYNVLDMTVGRRRHWFLHEFFLDLLELNRCDEMGTIPHDLTQYEKVLALYREDMKELGSAPPRLLSGDDVMELLKMPPGPDVKEILEELRLEQLEKNITSIDGAREWVQKKYGKKS